MGVTRTSESLSTVVQSYQVSARPAVLMIYTIDIPPSLYPIGEATYKLSNITWSHLHQKETGQVGGKAS